MFNRQVQTTRTRPIVSRLPCLHESIDADLYKPFVVANRLQALNFNVKGLQGKSSGSNRWPYCQPRSGQVAQLLQCSKRSRKRVA
jgi:hypothetical protein